MKLITNQREMVTGSRRGAVGIIQKGAFDTTHWPKKPSNLLTSGLRAMYIIRIDSWVN